MNDEKKKDITQDSHYCIFENRLCKYAHNESGAFDCTAPNDESMTCN